MKIGYVTIEHLEDGVHITVIDEKDNSNSVSLRIIGDTVTMKAKIKSYKFLPEEYVDRNDQVVLVLESRKKGKQMDRCARCNKEIESPDRCRVNLDQVGPMRTCRECAYGVLKIKDAFREAQNKAIALWLSSPNIGVESLFPTACAHAN